MMKSLITENLNCDLTFKNGFGWACHINMLIIFPFDFQFSSIHDNCRMFSVSAG